MIMDHIWPLSGLPGTLILKWSNMTECAKLLKKGNAETNMALIYHILKL